MLAACFLALVSAEQSLTFRDVDTSRECVISYDGDDKLTTSCAFDTASGNALAARVDALESGLASTQSGLTGVLNRLSAMDTSITTLSNQNSNQDTAITTLSNTNKNQDIAIAAVTKMEGPKVNSS
jgi:hypothetical protein